MTFPEDVVKDAWKRAGEKCECERTSCGHSGRCNKPLSWDKRGKESEDGWEAHHRESTGPDTLDNCEILCQDCHKNTGSFGG